MADHSATQLQFHGRQTQVDQQIRPGLECGRQGQCLAAHHPPIDYPYPDTARPR